MGAEESNIEMLRYAQHDSLVSSTSPFPTKGEGTILPSLVYPPLEGLSVYGGMGGNKREGEIDYSFFFDFEISPMPTRRGQNLKVALTCVWDQQSVMPSPLGSQGSYPPLNSQLSR
jgi:hypothetical protein